MDDEKRIHARGGYVQTVYGPMPGCPDCELIPLTSPLLCAHGVTPALDRIEIQLTAHFKDETLYRRVTEGG